MFAITGNSRRYRAHRKRSRILRRSRCGRTPPSGLRRSNKPSGDHKAKDHNRGKLFKRQVNRRKTKGRMIQVRANSLVPATTIGSEAKEASGSFLAVRSPRPPTLTTFHL